MRRAAAAALAFLAAVPMASAGFVTIANAANITQCLGLRGTDLIMADCLQGIGAEWNWTLQTARIDSHMQLGGWSAQGKNVCLDEDLKFKECNDKVVKWVWNAKTLQLQIRAEGVLWCLGWIGRELLMDHCHTVSVGLKEDQNGYGAPAEQTWVLFPTDRPQITILDKLKFPLRASGRNIIDSTGRRVKLVGVNWNGAQTPMLVNNGLAVAPLKHLAKTIKYMGFNSVRLNYASAMHVRDKSGKLPPVPEEDLLKANPELKGLSALEVFDRTVEAITDEGLLVIINRQVGQPRWGANTSDGNELWYGSGYTMEDWLESVSFMAERYAGNHRVIGVDILNEPRLREETSTVPWWGLDTPLTQIFGFRTVDWRAAAAQGAVAVWSGNPDALVIIEGQMFATNLQQVDSRPLKLAQDCLRSRLVYSSHEFEWFWQLHRFLSNVMDSFDPFFFFRDLKEITKVAVASEARAEAGEPLRSARDSISEDFSYSSGTPWVSYDHWADVRNEAVFYIQNKEKAPIWVSAFGTSTRRDNAWWDYVLQYFRDYDVSWAYSSLGVARVPLHSQDGASAHMADTYGIFDAHHGNYAAVVGWKLQDLVSIQAPSQNYPGHVEAPCKCTFDLTPNVEASGEVTSFFETLTTMSWSPKASLELLLFMSPVLILPCLIVACCLGRGAFTAAGCEGRNVFATRSKEKAYLALNSALNGVSQGPAKGQKANIVIDAKSIGIEEEQRTRRGRFFFCCSTPRSSTASLVPSPYKAPRFSAP